MSTIRTQVIKNKRPLEIKPQANKINNQNNKQKNIDPI